MMSSNNAENKDVSNKQQVISTSGSNKKNHLVVQSKITSFPHFVVFDSY